MTEFKCKRCGKCCGIVPFTKSEYKAIKNIAKKRHIGFVKQEMYGKIVYLPKKLVKELNDIYETKDINKVENLKCPFLEYDAMGKATCIIYENRPEVCILFGNGNHPCLKCPNYKMVAYMTPKAEEIALQQAIKIAQTVLKEIEEV